MMECLFNGGGSRKHAYNSYKTFFLRHTRYRCVRCHKDITAKQHRNWQEMWLKRDEMLRRHNEISNNIR